MNVLSRAMAALEAKMTALTGIDNWHFYGTLDALTGNSGRYRFSSLMTPMGNYTVFNVDWVVLIAGNTEAATLEQQNVYAIEICKKFHPSFAAFEGACIAGCQCVCTAIEFGGLETYASDAGYNEIGETRTALNITFQLRVPYAELN